jgi:Holliday junction resolvase RusA-like endonuclease
MSNAIQFFIPMIPPTTTGQMRKIAIVAGKPRLYDPPAVAAARAKLLAALAPHRPPQPFTGPVQLVTKWCFPRGLHPDGAWRATRPDTDNLQKLLKDSMTAAGFWVDDAQVCSEIAEKFWAEVPGIFIRVAPL